MDNTILTGNRSFVDGNKTYDTATIGVLAMVSCHNKSTPFLEDARDVSLCNTFVLLKVDEQTRVLGTTKISEIGSE
ncbi:hypothetical protein H5410_053095 [Solanum commersonii]|uniref:Uncharacterized protein n=1 Tax=Solanum commersonii TaxID=4109 RepID=A0A9J5X5A7_SOLCO|nr:hypothetical protein H5410_053095 [Solanum commersonii]